MTAIFPDSGVPYQDARNSLPNPIVNANCDPLWYSTSRCTPRFDPAAANAVLSELINLVNKGPVTFDCSVLTNVERAVRYLIQGGLPVGGVLTAGNQTYGLALDPPLLNYHNHLTLMVVPNVNNGGPVRLSVNGLGLVPVYRNDGQELRPNDIIANIPTEISYYNGAFYVAGLVPSQAVLSSQARFETPGSYTWVCPTGVYYVVADAYGGGGGGGTGDADELSTGVGVGGGGGAAAGYARKKITTVPGTAYAVVVGRGGRGGGQPGGGITEAGENGGTSNFASAVGATGGAGGNAGMNPIPGLPMPYAGVGVGGDYNLQGAGGSSGASGGNINGTYHGYGGLGGACGGPEGGGGGAMSTGSAGTGVPKGGGGSGGGSAAGINSPGGYGADGAIILSYVG